MYFMFTYFMVNTGLMETENKYCVHNRKQKKCCSGRQQYDQGYMVRDSGKIFTSDSKST